MTPRNQTKLKTRGKMNINQTQNLYLKYHEHNSIDIVNNLKWDVQIFILSIKKKYIIYV